MLKLKGYCENCEKLLPNNSSEAMICSFECTFCKDCVTQVLYNVCPNCGGGFEPRPTRPKHYLLKYPTVKEKVINPVIINPFLEKYKNKDPRKR